MRDTTAPERHAARATLYATVAVPFMYPTAERIDPLRDAQAREGVRRGADRLGFSTGAEELLAAIGETDLDDLQHAYDACFGLPGDDGAYQVVPYEAHYTAGEDVSHQQRRIATVVGLMERFGLEPGAGFDERQDHVAAELELLQVVASQRAVARHREDAETAGDLARAEATILAEHLVGFVPALAHDLRAHTDHPVYASVADLAGSLVEWDDRVHPDPAPVPTGPVAGEVRNGA